MGKKVSLAEYARHRGVSQAAVTYAIRDGRITFERDEKGRKLLDVDKADVQWNENTRHDKRVNGLGASPTDPVVSLEVNFEGSEDPEAAVMTVAEARAQRERYLAKLVKLEYEEKVGKLVPADQVQDRWTKVASIVRTKVLGIPAKVRTRLPDINADQYLAIEAIIREALEDLADGSP
jgi:hypothetical protein